MTLLELRINLIMMNDDDGDVDDVIFGCRFRGH